MRDEATKGTVFISYSHRDEKIKNEVVTFLKVMEHYGHLEIWDDRKIRAGAEWHDQIKKAIDNADAAVLLISADYLVSGFIREEEVPVLLQKREKEGMPVFPLIVKSCPWRKVTWLNSILVRPTDGDALDLFDEPQRNKILSDFAEEIHSILKRKETTEKPEPEPKPEPKPYAEPPAVIVDTAKLPDTGGVFLGREKELEQLDEAWEDENVHIVSLTAWGGVGKSALVNQWLNRIENDRYRGAGKVYGWSFYSQGAAEGKQAEADTFMRDQLAWFGDPDPTEGSAEEKGRRLAGLMQKEPFPCLLVLDGMEPLQYPPGAVPGMDGRLKDPGLKSFLATLARAKPFHGLCIVTSRLPVTDLEGYTGFVHRPVPLEKLSTGTGVRLLERLGVKGSREQLAAAVEEYGGHALALNLLAGYLTAVLEGDIRKKDLIPAITAEWDKGGHAKRVMAAYETWLGESPELDILRIMGLFDRPAESGAVAALRAAPPIDGVTEGLTPERLSEEAWTIAQTRLRGLRLLAAPDPQKPGVLDSHPLIREYFGERLQTRNPKGWQAAHRRLYEYYKALPENVLPDTLEEMEPLFAAVAHGCLAGLHQEALDEVYWKRISREDEQFIKHKLGAFGSDLAALSYFFETPWSRPASGLTEADQAWILSCTAFGLRAVGRLREALQPMTAGMELSLKQDDWKGASVDAGNLSELLLTLGEVAAAVDHARRAVAYADKSGDDFLMEGFRTALADALHQSGQLREAEDVFREAEAKQKKRQPQYPYLYSLQGYRFCDLLLTKGGGAVREVMERAEKTLEWVTGGGYLLSMALDNLTLGRAWMLDITARRRAGTRAPGAGGPADYDRPLTKLDEAVAGLRKAGYGEFLARGLIARAACYRLRREFDRAQNDLHEAKEIADMGDMKLHRCDVLLESARCMREQGNIQEAQIHAAEAKKLIDYTGYHRRDHEVDALSRPVGKKNPLLKRLWFFFRRK